MRRRRKEDRGLRRKKTENAKSIDLSDVLSEEVEEKVKEAAEISMGTEIIGEDIINIKHLCQQVSDCI